MTVQTAETKTHYAGNGLTTEWPIPFPVVREEHIKLIKTSPDGVDEEITTGYIVNGMESGAVSVTYPLDGAPLGAGWQLTIYRNMPLTQTLDLERGGAFDADVVEKHGFDHVVMQIQQVQEQTSRALQLAITDSDRTPDEVLGEMFELRDAAQQALASAQQASQATQDAIVQVEQTLRETVQTVQDAQQALQEMEALMQEVETLAESLEELGNLGEILQEVQTALGEVQDALTVLNALGPGAATVSGFTPLAPEGWGEGWALTLTADGSTTYSPKPDTPVDGKSIVLNTSKQVAAGTHLPGVASFQTRSISNGTISPTAADVVVDTEEAAAADDLTDINVTEAHNGMILRLWAANEARVITVKHSTTLQLAGQVDRVLSQHGYLELKRNGSYWQETPRKDVLELQAGKLDISAAFGVGQTYQTVTANRALGTTYTNTTNKPIFVSITVGKTNSAAPSWNYLFIDWTVAQGIYSFSGLGFVGVFAGVVPPGKTYSVAEASGWDLKHWFELR